MLQNAYLLAKIGADTAENEQHFAEFAKNWQRRPATRLPVGPWATHLLRRQVLLAGRGVDELQLTSGG